MTNGKQWWFIRDQSGDPRTRGLKKCPTLRYQDT